MTEKESPRMAAEAREKVYSGYYDERHLAMPLGHLIGIMQDASSNNMTYRGMKLNKHPCDAWVIQEIIWETNVKVILELGRGGSTFWLKSLVDLIVSVDVEPPPKGLGSVFTGDSEDPRVIRDVIQHIEEGKTWGHDRIMVIDDCSHTYANVTANLKNYGPLVSPGCYYIVEDTIINHGVFHRRHAEEKNDPMAAVKDFMAGEGSQIFEVDRSREKWYITSNPGGYLRRTGK